MLLTPKVATDDPEKTDVNQMVSEVLIIAFSLKLYQELTGGSSPSIHYLFLNLVDYEL